MKVFSPEKLRNCCTLDIFKGVRGKDEKRGIATACRVWVGYRVKVFFFFRLLKLQRETLGFLTVFWRPNQKKLCSFGLNRVILRLLMCSRVKDHG